MNHFQMNESIEFFTRISHHLNVITLSFYLNIQVYILRRWIEKRKSKSELFWLFSPSHLRPLPLTSKSRTTSKCNNIEKLPTLLFSSTNCESFFGFFQQTFQLSWSRKFQSCRGRAQWKKNIYFYDSRWTKNKD